MTLNLRIIPTLIYFLFFFAACTPSKTRTAASLTNTVKLHFAAIDARNIQDLLKTVHPEKVSLILPSGKYSTTLKDYQTINENWFADKNWRVEHEIMEQRINGNIGIVLAKITYHDMDENGAPYSFPYFLTLTFEHNGKDWRLIFDQNTLIKN